MKKNKRKALEIIIVILLCVITLTIVFFSMRLGRFVSLIIFGLSLIPILIAFVFKINLKKILPDIIFGLIDNVLLIIPAIIGAELFRAVGALAGAVVGNAISDGIAGLFEGSISERLPFGKNIPYIFQMKVNLFIGYLQKKCKPLFRVVFADINATQ